MQRVVVPSAALEAASILREEILRDIKDDEWLLGSEDEVMRSLEVSRPTLRQALRLLEQEQLVSVRRGVGGGLFARRPTEEGVTHTASVYLRAAGTSYGDLRSEEHTSELQSLMRISYAVFCLKKKKTN